MQHDTDLAARLARLDARRQATGTTAARSAARPAAQGPVATGRRRRPHAARRSRIGVTIGSAMAMVGLTGAMALADQTSSAADVATVETATAATTATTAAAGTGQSASNTVATTVTTAVAATPTTAAATQSNGS